MEYTPAQQDQLATELTADADGGQTMVVEVIGDYRILRKQVRACLN